MCLCVGVTAKFLWHPYYQYHFLRLLPCIVNDVFVSGVLFYHATMTFYHATMITTSTVSCIRVTMITGCNVPPTAIQSRSRRGGGGAGGGGRGGGDCCCYWLVIAAAAAAAAVTSAGGSTAMPLLVSSLDMGTSSFAVASCCYCYSCTLGYFIVINISFGTAKTQALTPKFDTSTSSLKCLCQQHALRTLTTFRGLPYRA